MIANLLEKDIKTTIFMIKELKEVVGKVKEIMHQQNTDINKELENLKGNQNLLFQSWEIQLKWNITRGIQRHISAGVANLRIRQCQWWIRGIQRKKIEERQRLWNMRNIIQQVKVHTMGSLWRRKEKGAGRLSEEIMGENSNLMKDTKLNKLQAG